MAYTSKGSFIPPMTWPANIFLDSLTELSVSEIGVDDRQCLICQDDMDSQKNRPLQLPCGHIFGRYCIRLWLWPVTSKPKNTCPMCRTVLFAKGPEYIIESAPGQGWADSLQEVNPEHSPVGPAPLREMVVNHVEGGGVMIRTQVVVSPHVPEQLMHNSNVVKLLRMLDSLQNEVREIAASARANDRPVEVLTFDMFEAVEAIKLIQEELRVLGVGLARKRGAIGTAEGVSERG